MQLWRADNKMSIRTFTRIHGKKHDQVLDKNCYYEFIVFADQPASSLLGWMKGIGSII